jgi:hypothetical protein
MKARIVRSAAGAVTAAALVISGGAIAQASDSAPNAEAVAQTIEAVSPMADLAVTPTITASGIEVATDTGTVALPKDSSGQIVIDAAAGADAFAVGLPDVDASAAKVTDDGTVVYSSGGAVDLAVQSNGSSARIHTVLNDATAPSGYTYTFTGATPVLQEDGTVLLTAESDGMSVDFAAIEVPWAYGADGQPVPTSYRVEGDVVVQELDLTGDVAYPIVADPWIQGDCGIVTCTVRFDRATTRNIRDGSGLTSIAGGIVTIFSGGILLPVVGVISGFLGANAIIAGRYYENGNCFGIKIVPGGVVNPWWPTQVTKNTYNCR